MPYFSFPRLIVSLVLLVLGWGLTVPCVAGAQSPYRVIDLDPETTAEQSSTPRHLLRLGNLAFFVAGRPDSGREVWASDGTPGGTRLLVDIRPGPETSSPRILGHLGHVVFFTGFTQSRRELWRSDGTQTGTFRLREYRRTLIDETWAVADGYLMLAEDDGNETRLFRSDGTPGGTFDVVTLPQGQPYLASRGAEVGIFDRQGGFWISDGTPGGTTQLIDLSLGSGALRPLVSTSERYFFLASQNGGPTQLWSTEGATVLPVTSFSSAVSIDSLVVGESEAYLTVSTTSGRVVWRSDGSFSGTRTLTPTNVRGTGFAEGQFVELPGGVVFSGTEVGNSTRRLFASDGTPAGTSRLSDELIVGIEPWVRVGDRVVVEGLHPSDGFQLWTTDGNPAGTLLLLDHCAAGESCLGQNHALAPGLDGVVFASETAADGFELWTSDATPQGARRVTDFVEEDPLPAHFEPDPWLVADADTLVFAADAAGLGQELWQTNGAPGSTTLVADVAPADAASSIRELGTLGGRLLFTACDGDQLGLWSTGGSEADTQLLQLFGGSAGCQPEAGGLVKVGGTRLFLTFGERELWVTDGTVGGTRQLLDTTGTSRLIRDHRVAAGQHLLFVMGQPGPDVFWVSDGTVTGTGPFAPLADFGIQADVSSVSVDERAFLRIEDVDGDGDLLATDGTVAGTELLRHFDDFFPSQPLEAVDLGGISYLSVGTGPNGLWQSDGTAGGTFEVLPLSATSGIGRPRDLAVLGDQILFVTGFDADEDALWSSDGSGDPPTLLTRFPKAPPGSEPAPLEPTTVGDRLYFVIDDGLRGRELWSTDSTPGGTAPFADIVPGAPSGNPHGLTTLGDRLYFAASNTFGRELWTLAGTTTGVARVGDIAPGAASSSPEQLTAAGDRLYFTADDLASGRELWAVGTEPSACTASGTTLCLGSGRFRATIQWTDFAANSDTGHAVPLSDDTGAFWFFDAQNLEAMVKVIDGRETNGHFWVFYGALTNVAFELTVEDLVTGASKTYSNPLGTFASQGDIDALPGG